MHNNKIFNSTIYLCRACRTNIIFCICFTGLVSPRLAEGISKVYNQSSNFLKKGANTLGRMTTNGEKISRDVIDSFLSFLFSPKQAEKTLTNIDLCSELKSAPTGSFTYRLVFIHSQYRVNSVTKFKSIIIIVFFS